MNWLAHLLLSEPAPEFQLGGILPDLAPATVLRAMPAEFQGGIRRHWQIDAFTDTHVIFRRSLGRLQPPFRRYAGVLVDIFYDHFLTCEWARFSDAPLRSFVAEFYASFERWRALVPAEVYARLEAMREYDWLCSYGELAGLETTLRRMSFRLKRPFDLAASVGELEREYDGLREDFHAFFPELRRQVAKEAEARNGNLQRSVFKETFAG